MRILTTLLILLIALPAFAGMQLSDQQISATDFSSRGTYYLEDNVDIVFDTDVSEYLVHTIMKQINDDLVDINVNSKLADKDYDHAIHVLGNWKKPNQIFVHLGRGWHGHSKTGASANLRSYEGQPGTCIVKLHKELFNTWSFDNQVKVLRHELYHCFLWGHSLVSQDLDTFDNYEVLLRNFDKLNTKRACNVTIIKEPKQRVDFIGKRRTKQYPVSTRDNNVRLYPGRYKVKVDGKRIKKKFNCPSGNKELVVQ